MSDLPQMNVPYAVECPHCHKRFEGQLLARGPRHRGFKCPHCKLFVPYERADEQDLVEPVARDTPS